MAIELGVAYITVLPETNKLAAGITGQLKQAESGADAAGRGMGSKFTGGFKTAAVGLAVAGGAALAAAGAGAVVGLKSAVSAASGLGESVNAVNVVFGDASEGVLQLSRDAATAVGLSQTEFNGLAVRFSSFATTVAGAGGNVTGTLDDLTTRAADFASVMNLDVADAAQVFQSGLAGESEPLRQFGIDLSAAAVNSFAAANGIGTLGTELTEQEKVQARYGLLMQETAVAQGDFADTSDSLANRQRILGATIDDIKARIGDAFLPVVERAFGFILNTAIPAVERMVDEFQAGQGPIFALSETFRNDVYPRLVDFRDFVRDEVLPRVQDFIGFVRTEVIPRVQELADRFQTQVMPRLRDVAEYLRTTFQPTFDALVILYQERVKPAVDQIREAFERNKPQLLLVAEFIGKVAAVALYLYTQIVGFLYPILVKLAGYLIDNVVRNFTLTLDAIGLVVDIVVGLYDAFQDARTAVGDFVGKLDDVKLPSWVRTLADLVKDIGKGLGDGAKNVASFFGFGDAPAPRAGVSRFGGNGGGGSFGGGRSAQAYSGTALARVNQMGLGAGLRITSTYRSPAKNRSVGGSPTSLHMDRNNPAVDIAGSRSAMDRMAARLRAVGGWRQLLYRIPDGSHDDHIHVAHRGGPVESSWGTMPGLRADERPAILQVGERVIPKGEAAQGGGFGLYLPSSVALRVDDREFTAYVEDVSSEKARRDQRMYQGA